MKIYTKTGDKGKTSLIGGERVDKNDPRIEAIGAVDELNAMIGLVVPQLPENMADLTPELEVIQNVLFDIGAELASLSERKTIAMKIPVVEKAYVMGLERLIDHYTTELEPLTHFVLPGGTALSGLFQVARAVCRRTERRIIDLTDDHAVNPELIGFINRLSDFLFTAARLANKRAGQKEVLWDAGN